MLYDDKSFNWKSNYYTKIADKKNNFPFNCFILRLYNWRINIMAGQYAICINGSVQNKWLSNIVTWNNFYYITENSPTPP